jgi:glutamine synthetase
MKEEIEHFKVAQDLVDYLEKFERFRLKRFIQTSENDFYVGTEMEFFFIENEKHKTYYHKGLDMYVTGTIDYITMRDVNNGSSRRIKTTYKSLKHFLKDYEPIVLEKEIYKIKAKLFNFEIIIR